MDKDLTTFIIPTIGRKTLRRAIFSVTKHGWKYLCEYDEKREEPSVIRNRLIEQATTPWVSFLDDDDSITEDYVERLIEALKETPDLDLVHFRAYFLRGMVVPAWPTIEWGNVGISFSVKREVALKHPFQTEKYEDFNFVKRLYEAGYNIGFDPHITYHVRH